MKALAVAFIISLLVGSFAFAEEVEHYHGIKSYPTHDFLELSKTAKDLGEVQGATNMLDDCIIRYGGVEKLQALKGFRILYDMKPNFTNKTIEFKRSFAQGRHYLSETDMDRRVISGNDGWIANADTSISIFSGRYKAELFSYITLAMPLAARTERFDSIRYLEVEDDPLGYFFFEKTDSLITVIGIDPADHLIKTVAGVIFQEESSFSFVNFMDDHQEYEGYLFPKTLINVSLKLKVGESILRSVEINPDFPPGEFKDGLLQR